MTRKTDFSKVYTLKIQFKSYAPIMAYQQHDQNICCFNYLASALKASNEFSAENTIATRISSLLTGKILNRIEFSNAIITEEARKKDINIYVINWNNGRKLALLIFLIISVSM